MRVYRLMGWTVLSIVLSAVLAIALFWVFAVVTGGRYM
jgi:hypothetical protein